MAAEQEQLKALVEAIFSAHEADDIDCDTCSQQFDCLAELVRRGANLRELLPAVEEHLRCCPDCREEFNALMLIVRAEESGALASPTADE